MMILPMIRMGPPPGRTLVERSQHYVVLTPNGWSMVVWHTPETLSDCDESIPPHNRIIRVGDVLCWMPEDGS